MSNVKEKVKAFENTLSKAQKVMYRLTLKYLTVKKGFDIDKASEEDIQAINDEFLDQCNKARFH